MKRVNFTIHTVELEAAKYTSKSEFAKCDKAAYNFAQKNKILDKICSHMDHDYWRWTDEELETEALKYKTKKEFLKGNRGAYSSANSKGLLNKITAHMEPLWEKKWDVDSIIAEALKYRTKKEFLIGNKGAYVAACRRKILKRVTLHMTSDKRDNWTESEIIEEAKKYESRKDFSKKSSGAYNAATRLGILEQVCCHMIPLTNLTIRALYAFEHSDKSVYVGLTWNYKNRYSQHMNGNKILIEKKHLNQTFITFNKWYPVIEAGKAEIDLIEKYKAEGWTILNKSKGGALGGRRLYWTPEKIPTEALKYSTRTDFRKKSSGAYKNAVTYGILEQACSHMINYRELK